MEVMVVLPWQPEMAATWGYRAEIWPRATLLSISGMPCSRA